MHCIEDKGRVGIEAEVEVEFESINLQGEKKRGFTGEVVSDFITM